MLMTELGISMLVKLVQSLKAKSPMLMTELGIFMLVKPVHPLYLQIVLYKRLTC